MKQFYKTIGRLLLPVFLLALHESGFAQIKIHGTVYNMNRNLVLPAVSVMSTSGSGTTTDSTGSYSFIVLETDSIWFSYLNKPTPKFPVSDIIRQNGVFDVALHVPVTELKEVRVVPRNYKLDSLQNRLDYAKAFNFKKPGISLSAPNSSNFGVGLDLDEFINMFNFKKNRRMLAFQRRLLQEEEDKYVDHRFTKPLVRKITGLSGVGPVMDDFMKKYRPSYEFAVTATDYEFAEYIKLAWIQYKTRM